mgnify:CR=1 FL=1
MAIKVIKLRNAKRITASLANEVSVHSLLRHPNIVQIMGVSFLKNSFYIISELIDEKNLDEILFGEDESSALHSSEKWFIIKQICKAVAYMHNLKPQVIHRDIKPANILVTRGSNISKLCDMGLSKLKSSHPSLTKTSLSTSGTPQYMAPECVLQGKSATASSDVWSMACTVVECLTGEDFWKD